MNRTGTLPHRVFALLLAVALLCTACAPKAEATTMRLAKALGTVTVADGGGKEVAVMENLGLYSGYQVDTRTDSYAWINLDEVKLTKLDADSQMEIRKDGKKLEILVLSGSLFFRVTEPLAEDETMHIRTSTMVMGIRGTCGWVEAVDENHLRVSLLEGTVECTVTDEDGRILAAQAVTAGEMAELVRAGAESSITVTPLTQIPGFVREEITRQEADGVTGSQGISAAVEEADQRVQAEQERNAALLAVLNALDEEQAMYALLGDLDGNGGDDLLVFGKYLYSKYNRGYDFAFTAYLWDEASGTVQTVPLTQTDYLEGFGSNSYGVYRDRATGVLYGQYSFFMDTVVSVDLESAAEHVPFGYDYIYEPDMIGAYGLSTWDEAQARNERLDSEMHAAIDARFELVDPLKFDREDDPYGWSSFWSGYSWAQRPSLPAFHASVDEARRQLSEGAGGSTVTSVGSGTAEQAVQLPAQVEGLELGFSSGAGAWGSSLVLHADGSFEGSYHDSNMGERGPGYLATVYYSVFQGQFDQVTRIDDYTYALTLGSMTLQDPAGSERIDENQVRYVASEPYGMEDCQEFLLYLPGASATGMSDAFKNWRWGGVTGQLDCWALCNTTHQYGFFSG